MANAVSYKYTGGTSLTTVQPVSAFTLDAPLLYDGAVGDTTTSNYVTQTGSGGGSYYFYALIDLGSSPPSVSKVEAEISGGGWVLYASNDGTTWTNITNGTNPETAGTPVSFTAVTYRYWQLACSFGGGYPGNYGAYDFRLYDDSGTLIGSPSSAQSYTKTIAASVSTSANLSETVSYQPVGWWKLDETGTTTTAADSSGNGYNGTLTNFTFDGSSNYWTSSGKINGALQFNGYNNYISCGNPTAFQISSGTYSAWFKTFGAGSSYRGIIAKQGAYGCFLRDNYLILYDWGLGVERSTSYNLADNNWHHILVTFQLNVNNGTNVYLDGTLVLTTYTSIADQNTEVQIGSGGNSGGQEVAQYFYGQIDDVRIYNQVLSPTQIQAVYNYQGTQSYTKIIAATVSTTAKTNKELTKQISGTVSTSAVLAENKIVGTGFTYSTSNASPLGSAGMTQLDLSTSTGGTSNFDDSDMLLPDIGFPFNYYGTNFQSNIYIGSNSYLTFGFGSDTYQPTLTDPGLAILVAAVDRSWNNVYVKADNAGKSYRIRFEGGSSSNNPSALDLVWEVTLFADKTFMITSSITEPVNGNGDGITGTTDGTGTAGKYNTTSTWQGTTSTVYRWNSTTGNYDVSNGSYSYTGSGSSSTYPKTIAASVSTTAKTGKAIGKKISGTVSTSANTGRLISKKLSGTVSTSAKVNKGLSKTIASGVSTSAGVSSALNTRSLSQTIAASVSTSAGVGKSVTKHYSQAVSASVSTSTALGKSVAKSVYGTVTTSVNSNKSISKNVVGIASTSAVVQSSRNSRIYTQSISASVSTSAGTGTSVNAYQHYTKNIAASVNSTLVFNPRKGTNVTDNRFYFQGYGGNQYCDLDKDTVSAVGISGAMYFSPDNTKFYTNNVNTVLSTTILTNSTKTISFPNLGTVISMTFNHAGTRLFVYGFNNSYIVDTTTDTVIATIATPNNNSNGYSQITYTPDDSKILFFNEDTFYIVDTTSYNLTTTNLVMWSFGRNSYFYLEPNGRYVYFATSSPVTSITVYDLTTSSVVTTISITSTYSLQSFNSFNGRYFYFFDGNSISVIDTVSNTLATRITGLANLDYTSKILVSNDGSNIYISNTTDSVYVISQSNNTLLATVTGFSTPNTLLMSPDGTTVYVYENNVISKINTSTFNRTVFVSATARAGILSNDGSKLFMTTTAANLYEYNTTTAALTNTFYNTTNGDSTIFYSPKSVHVLNYAAQNTKTVAASVSTTLKFGRQIKKTISVVANTTPNVSRLLNKNINASVNTSVSINKAASKRISAVSSTIAKVFRNKPVTISATVNITPNVRTGNAVFITINAVSNLTAGINKPTRRKISLASSVNSSSQILIGKGNFKTISTGVVTTIQLAKLKKALTADINGSVFRQMDNYLTILKEGKYKLMANPTQLLAILDSVSNEYANLAPAIIEIAQNLQNSLPLIAGDGTAILGTGDDNFILTVLPAAMSAVQNANPDAIANSIYGNFFATLNSYFAQSSNTNYSNLDTYATYQNSQALNSFLVNDATAYLYWLQRGKSTQSVSMKMQPTNVFAPQTNFGFGTVGNAGSVTLTLGNIIPTANTLTQQGYVGSKGITASITTPINGTLTITVKANGMDTHNALVGNRTWTGTLDNASQNASIALIPAIAGDRINSVISVTGTGTATAGAFSLNSVLER